MLGTALAVGLCAAASCGKAFTSDDDAGVGGQAGAPTTGGGGAPTTVTGTGTGTGGGTVTSSPTTGTDTTTCVSCTTSTSYTFWTTTNTSSWSCSHGECEVGAALVLGCSPCASAVCAVLPSCCSGEWTTACVGFVDSVCSPPPC